MRLHLSLAGVSAFELSRQIPRSSSSDLSRLSIPFAPGHHHNCSCISTTTNTARLNATTNIEATGFWNFSFDGNKLTASVHLIWKEVAKLGDTVIDATCGNGLDTLRLAKLVCGEGEQGVVYGFDLQQSALDNTACLLERELNPAQRERVKLLHMCHSKLGEVVGNNEVSVVAFNLGYLPRGDKDIITQVETTVKALKSATGLLRSGGMITIIAYIGHPGGREEYEAVREFCTSLPTSSWICSHHECLNRPLCPHLLLLARK